MGQLFIKVRKVDATMPERIETAGLEVVFSGQQSSINIINGVQTVETTYFYRFSGDEPGTFTIPEFEIRVGQRVVKTRPIVITVFERDGTEVALDATKPHFAKLELTRDTFYVNELVPFTLTAYVRGRNAISDVVSAALKHESFVFKSFREVRTDGADVGNSYYSSAVIPSHLFALKPGAHRLGPAEVAVRVLDAEAGFGLSAFFQRTATREMVTNTINVTVKPLPDGAPASFTGGIGNFEFTATPSITTLGVGDPISIEFEVTGTGNLRTMNAPVFAIPQTGVWKTYEASKELNDEEDSDGFKTGKIRFSQVIIPEARTETIPEFHLTFCDPAKEQYVTLKSGPVPITVTQDETAEAPVAIAYPAGGADPAMPKAKRPEVSFNDIMHIRTGAPRWISANAGTGPGALFYAVQVLCSIALFTIAGFGVARWIEAARQRRLTPVSEIPFARALKLIPRTGAPRREFFHAVTVAIESWKREHPDAPAPVREVVDRISGRCDLVLYSGQAQPDVPVSAGEVEEFTTLLRRLPQR